MAQFDNRAAILAR